MSSFLLGLLMTFLTQSKFSNLILTQAKVRTRYRGIQTRLTKAINFPPWVKFTYFECTKKPKCKTLEEWLRTLSPRVEDNYTHVKNTHTLSPV